MGDLEKGKIYQYIERKYDEVEARDNGSHPLTQDTEVFNDASNKFGIPVDELKKIHGQYAAHLARLEMLKTKRLPAIQRKKLIERRATDILKNNKDLPFNAIEGGPSQPLPKGLDLLLNEYEDLVIKLSNNGWILSMLFNLSHLDKMNNLQNDVEIQEYFESFFTGKRLRIIDKHVKNSPLKENYKELFSECLEAIDSNKYGLAIHSLIPILEGALSTFYSDPTNVRMMKICKERMESTKNDGKNIEYLFWLSHSTFIQELYARSNFDLDEPDSMNRHWILHGRTEKEFTHMDCVKVINAIHCLVTLGRYT